MTLWPDGSLLSTLRGEAAGTLLRMGTRLSFTPAHVLMREGDVSTYVIVLRQGFVKVTAGLENGREALMSIRAGGDVVGELSALDGGPRSATVTTCGPVQVNRIAAAEFGAFLRRNPDAALAVSRGIADQLRFATRRRADFTGCQVGTRLARVLVELADNYGRATRYGIRFAVKLTQQELGAMAGAAEDSVHRELRRLAAHSVIDTQYRNILVRDLDALRLRARQAE